MPLVGVILNPENDPNRPYALQVRFPMGVVTQPCDQSELYDVLRALVKDAGSEHLTIDVEVRRQRG